MEVFCLADIVEINSATGVVMWGGVVMVSDVRALRFERQLLRKMG